MLTDAKRTIGLAELKLRAKWRLVGDQLPMAVDLASVFDAELEGFLVGDEDVANVHLSDGELSLGSLTLASEVEG